MGQYLFEILFFVSVFLIFYSYVLFPAFLGVLVSLRKKKSDVPSENFQFPEVSILIPVFNEEAVIHHKLESIISLDYPKDKIEVIVGSDFSDDKTVEIVKGYLSGHSNIRLEEFQQRRGKPSVINDLVSLAKNKILVMTDANVFFDKQMLRQIVKHFIDERIGLAGANILNTGTKKKGISIQEKSYIERENMIKFREGLLWGCMMGPFGGCYAMRKELFEKIPAGFLVDDFYVSMKVIEKNFYCVNDLDAVCFEDVPDNIILEYRRKSRISAGNFQNLKKFSRFLFRPFSAAGFCFIIHKFLRWITPFLILISLVSVAVLSTRSYFYQIFLLGEILLLISPFFDWILSRIGVQIKLVRFVAYFTVMNLALLKGFFHYMSGVKSGVWTPTPRTV